MKLQELEALKSGDKEAIKKAVEFIELVLSKPEIEMYIALSKLVSKLTKDILDISEVSGNLLDSEKDDKAFDRINTIIKNFSQYKDSLVSGREAFMKQDEQEDFFSKRRNSKQK